MQAGTQAVALKETRLQELYRKLNFGNIFWLSLIHFLAIGSLFFFTWSGFFVMLFGVFIIAPLGINVGYHRLLTHKSFTAPRWVRNTLVTMGTMIGGGPPIHWAAMHRVHHRFSDTHQDPHNSKRGFWYSHVMHLFMKDDLEEGNDYLNDYAPDLQKDAYLRFLNKHGTWLAVAVLPMLYVGGGWSWLFWGGFMRTALTWNIMWFVNSASHMWGYRNYETKDDTVNCWWVGLLAAGEGWHNNHHAFPSKAAHGHKPWELDWSFLMIRILARMGLATNIK